MLVFRYFLRQVLRKKEKEAGKGTQYIITRVQVRARLVRAKKTRKGENSCRMERKILPEKGKNVRSDGKSIPENADFSAGKSRKKCENDENGQKNFFPRSGKNIKISPTERKKS